MKIDKEKEVENKNTQEEKWQDSQEEGSKNR